MLEQGTLSLIMPKDFLGPTLEEVQVWLRSSPDSARAGFVLSVEVVSARLGRVLVVEDDPGIANGLVRGLTRAGYETGSVTTGQAALDWPVPDVVLLDLGLPDDDGLTLLRDMRRRGDSTPVLVLTARDGVTDRVTGLREGADDYLPKPFAMEELVARLQALLRRPGNLLGRLLTFGNVSLDTDGRQVFVAGAPRSFPARETAVLEILLRRGGNVAVRCARAAAGSSDSRLLAHPIA